MTLKELRIKKGLTQADASSLCGVPLRTYKRLENDLSYSGYFKYQHALNVLKNAKQKPIDNCKSHSVLIIGGGFVGLSTARLLSKNNDVSVIDIDASIVDKINNNYKGKIKAYLPNDNLYKNKDYIIICLPTNYDESSKTLDTFLIKNYVNSIRKINKKTLIVIKSTCGIGFNKSLNDKNLIYCPEFLREKHAYDDSLNPSRIVIGGNKNNIKVKSFVSMLLNLVNNNPDVYYMSYEEAEAVKLFSNAYLAMRVAFFNELDMISDIHEMDSRNIIKGVCADPRIGDYYNNPSFGYGGTCLPKDTKELSGYFKNMPNSLISSIISSNQNRKEYIAKEILNIVNQSSIIGIYKISKNSPTLDILDILLNNKIKVVIYGPSLNKNHFLGCEIINDIDSFKKITTLIIADRVDSYLIDVKDKVYTKDLFSLT